jgi:hypothetical protein
VSDRDIEARPPIDLSDDEVRERIRGAARSAPLGYADYVAELDRRARWRQARASFALSIVSVLIALGAVAVALLRH